jgi:hypothetical protein
VGIDGVLLRAASEVVGGEVPTYIPDQIMPENAESQIVADVARTEGTSVSDATSRLRELRRSKDPEDLDLDFG